MQEYCYTGSDMITRENWTHEKDILSKEKRNHGEWWK